MPIRDILLDASGNRLLAGATYGFADGIQAVKQGIECALRLQLSEYWLDESLGVPYTQLILVRSPNPIVVKSVLGSTIAGVVDVTNVSNATYAQDARTRSAIASYTAASTAGTITGAVSVPQ